MRKRSFRRHCCDYQAIEPTDKADYVKCFQCLECVETHDSEKACLPLVLQRTGKTIPVRMVTAKAAP